MSQNFASFPVLPYVGAPYGQNTYIHSPINAMDKQSKTCRLDINWTAYGASPANDTIGVNVNLQSGQSGVTAVLDALRSIYIDNSFSPVPIFVQFPDTLYTVICPAFAVVMSPVFTFGQQFTIYAQGFQIGQAPTTSVFCMNTLHDGFYVPTTQSGAAPTLPVTYALTDRYILGYTGNLNIPTINIGPADADRWIALLLSQAWQNSVVAISAITIGGIAAVKQTGQVANLGGLNSNSGSSEIWMAKVPTGTTAAVTIVVTNSGGVTIRPLMDFYAIQNLVNPPYQQPLSVKNQPGAISLTNVHDTKVNGAVLGTYCGNSIGGTPSWINLSQDDFNTLGQMQAGAGSFLSSQNVQRTVGNSYANTFASIALA